jgi:hypothetical protein
MHVQVHMCICACTVARRGGTMLAVSTRSRRRRRDPDVPAVPATSAVSSVVALSVLDAFLIGLFVAAALLAQPTVATIAGAACASVSLQIAHQLRPGGRGGRPGGDSGDVC